MKTKAPTYSLDAQEKKWQTEDDLRTLTRAEEIKKDPKRMEACREMAKERMTEMAQFMGDHKK